MVGRPGTGTPCGLPSPRVNGGRGVSAPLVVEATERVLGGLVGRTGALSAGQAFDAEDFLRSLPLDHLSLP